MLEILVTTMCSDSPAQDIEQSYSDPRIEDAFRVCALPVDFKLTT